MCTSRGNAARVFLRRRRRGEGIRPPGPFGGWVDAVGGATPPAKWKAARRPIVHEAGLPDHGVSKRAGGRPEWRRALEDLRVLSASDRSRMGKGGPGRRETGRRFPNTGHDLHDDANYWADAGNGGFTEYDPALELGAGYHPRYQTGAEPYTASPRWGCVSSSEWLRTARHPGQRGGGLGRAPILFRHVRPRSSRARQRARCESGVGGAGGTRGLSPSFLGPPGRRSCLAGRRHRLSLRPANGGELNGQRENRGSTSSLDEAGRIRAFSSADPGSGAAPTAARAAAVAGESPSSGPGGPGAWKPKLEGGSLNPHDDISDPAPSGGDPPAAEGAALDGSGTCARREAACARRAASAQQSAWTGGSRGAGAPRISSPWSTTSSPAGRRRLAGEAPRRTLQPHGPGSRGVRGVAGRATAPFRTSDISLPPRPKPCVESWSTAPGGGRRPNADLLPELDLDDLELAARGGRRSPAGREHEALDHLATMGYAAIRHPPLLARLSFEEAAETWPSPFPRRSSGWPIPCVAQGRDDTTWLARGGADRRHPTRLVRGGEWGRG